MFNHLTAYLLQYRKVSIPMIGTIRLVQQPPQFNVADKQITPPSFTTEVDGEDAVSDHQLNYLAAAIQQEKETVRQTLTEWGERWQRAFRGEGFQWKGIGLIRQQGQSAPVVPASLVPVPAHKVVRTGAAHSVLVGDQQMTSTQITDLREEKNVSKSRSVWMVIGWVLLLLSLLYIFFIVYQGKFRVGTTGSRQAPTSWVPVNVTPVHVNPFTVLEG